MGKKAQKCHYDNKLEREINSSEIAPGFMRILKISTGWSCKQTMLLLSILHKIGTHTKEMVHKTNQPTEKGEMQFGKMVCKQMIEKENYKLAERSSCNTSKLLNLQVRKFITTNNDLTGNWISSIFYTFRQLYFCFLGYKRQGVCSLFQKILKIT